ncbi:MAG: MBL fold metallo-hydrolase [Proteobacteria bacterium]|nr:MBL fold metallo-hydrolase [Pseudomonadota bacterium]
MQIIFLGVGEALDAKQPNTSILVLPDNQQQNGQILLDCGFTTPHQYFKLHSSPEELDLVWISHFHGDHFLGVPLLILRFWEMNRQNPLTIVGQNGIADKISQALELAYPGLQNRLGFPLVFKEISPEAPLQINTIEWQTAFNEHSQPCLSLRLNQDDRSLFYSGDGRPTPATLLLAAGCDIIIHEAYRFQEDTPGHGSIAGCIDFAKKAGVKRLALLHIQHADRLQFMPEIHKMVNQLDTIEILLPESGDILEI